MSRLARVLALGVMLAAVNLVGMTAVAQADATGHTIKPYASAPVEPHAGESNRRGQVTSRTQTATSDAVKLFLEQFHRGERASQEQTTADAALQRVLAKEHGYSYGGTPAGVTSPVRPAEPSGQPGPPVVALGVLAAALVGALAAMTARRASRRVRPRQAA